MQKLPSLRYLVMSKVMGAWLLIACVGIILVHGNAHADQNNSPVPNCPFIPMPADGKIIAEPGAILPGFVLYPATIPAGYSGCAYAWMLEHGPAKPFSIASFKKGRLIRGTIPDYADQPAPCKVPVEDDDNEASCTEFVRFWNDAQKYLYKKALAKPI
ncbi:hypothetical protein [Massilia niabensis]|uniref:Lipoprotein n=1 Tax=Massilia niabensis TaxID=544910 RepID=A0ABW0L4Y0_9BURK